MERSIEATTYIRAPASRACDVLRDDPSRVFTDSCTTEQRRNRRFRVSLVVTVGAGAAVEQEVDLELGRPLPEGEVITSPIKWHPTGHRRILPSFDGELVVRPNRAGKTQMSLQGIYRLPLGPIGRFGDGVVGRRVARRTIVDLLNRIARSLDEEVDRRLRSVPYGPAPYPQDMRERPR